MLPIYCLCGSFNIDKIKLGQVFVQFARSSAQSCSCSEIFDKGFGVVFRFFDTQIQWVNIGNRVIALLLCPIPQHKVREKSEISSSQKSEFETSEAYVAWRKFSYAALVNRQAAGCVAFYDFWSVSVLQTRQRAVCLYAVGCKNCKVASVRKRKSGTAELIGSFAGYFLQNVQRFLQILFKFSQRKLVGVQMSIAV